MDDDALEAHLRRPEDEQRRLPAETLDAFLRRAGIPEIAAGGEAAAIGDAFRTLTGRELPLTLPAGLRRLELPGLVAGNAEAASLVALRNAWCRAGAQPLASEDGDPDALPHDADAPSFWVGFEVGGNRVDGYGVRFVLQQSIDRGTLDVSAAWPEDPHQAARLAAAVADALRQHAALWRRPEAWTIAELSATLQAAGPARVGAKFVDGTRTHHDDHARLDRVDPFEQVFVARRLALPGRPLDPRLSFLGPVVIAGADGPRLPLP